MPRRSRTSQRSRSRRLDRRRSLPLPPISEVTLVKPETAATPTPLPRSQAVPRIRRDYSHVASDLRRIAVTAGVIILLIVVLAIVYR